MNILEAISELVKFPSDVLMNHSDDPMTTDNEFDSLSDSSIINFQTENLITIKKEPNSIQSSKCSSTKVDSQPLASKASWENRISIVKCESLASQIRINVEPNLFTEESSPLTATKLKRDKRFILTMVNGKEMLCCCKCHKIFDYVDFDAHFHEAHQKPGLFICELCNKSYPSKPALLLHKRRVHISSKNNICKICGKRYKNTSSMKYHMDTSHLKVEEWKCPICNISCTTKYGLQNHKKIHSTDRELYICQICNKKYKHKKCLYEHERSAHLKINWKCRFCDKTFAHKNKMAQHQKVHYTIIDVNEN